MRAIKWVRSLALAGSLIVGCYRGGDRLDLDLDELERIQLATASGRFEVWVARTTEERSKGLAVVEPDRLEPLADGTFRGLLQVLPDGGSAELSFPLRMVPMDVATLGGKGRVRQLWQLPGRAPQLQGEAFVLEAPSGSFALAGVEVGSWIKGLPARD